MRESVDGVEGYSVSYLLIGRVTRKFASDLTCHKNIKVYRSHAPSEWYSFATAHVGFSSFWTDGDKQPLTLLFDRLWTTSGRAKFDIPLAFLPLRYPLDRIYALGYKSPH